MQFPVLQPPGEQTEAQAASYQQFDAHKCEREWEPTKIFCVCRTPDRPSKLARDITVTGETNGSPWLPPVMITTGIPICFSASKRSDVEV
jgi:hypothetical protein